jgi:hypothetical protein
MPPPAAASDRPGLKRDLLSLINDGSNPMVQVEVSRLMSWLAVQEEEKGENEIGAGEIAMIEVAIAALKAKTPNIRVAKFAHNQLEIQRRNLKGGPVPWISRRLGDSAVYAMLVGVVCSAALWIVIVPAAFWGSQLWDATIGTKPIFPLPDVSALLIAAFVGGLVSVLSRVNDFANLFIFDPFLVFINSLLKPLIGTVLALTIYAIIKSGIIDVAAINFKEDPTGRYIFWAFGFVAGFSERLAGDFLARAESVVGGTGEKTQSAHKEDQAS